MTPRIFRVVYGYTVVTVKDSDGGRALRRIQMLHRFFPGRIDAWQPRQGSSVAGCWRAWKEPVK